ncbi:hypothetical protein NQ318_010973 [Aromia moschata]|uniref:Uncharacterized protein n=1 Tax=Aromia moschata TaxID=1265417 RepID=A0AAV8YN14_9CUCU|nr:hypothetical protein NQ318_010973 [Aromia moschata]
MNYLPKTCKKKWENLLRTYRSCKDLKKNRPRCNKATPTNSSPHSVDVFNIAVSEQQASREDTPPPLESQRKRKSSTMEYVKLTTEYYEEKRKEKIGREETKTKYLKAVLHIVEKRKEKIGRGRDK